MIKKASTLLIFHKISAFKNQYIYKEILRKIYFS